MPNPYRGEVPFTANGKEYILRLDVEALCCLEEQTKKGIISLLSELQDPQKITLTLARQMLWAGLQEKHSGISLKEAGDLIPALGGLAKLVNLFSDAMNARFTETEGQTEDHPPKAGNPTNGIGPRSTDHGQSLEGTPTPSGVSPSVNSP